jgi:hypothetical protein
LQALTAANYKANLLEFAAKSSCKLQTTNYKGQSVSICSNVLLNPTRQKQKQPIMSLDLDLHDAIRIAESLGGITLKSAGYNDWRAPCPLHNGVKKKNFSVFQKGSQPSWRCFSDCDEGGSIIDLARRLLREPDSKEGWRRSYQEIRSLLNLPDYYNAKRQRRTNQSQVVKIATDPGPPPQEWQKAAWGLVDRFQSVLWEDTGARARQWLAERYGLLDSTIQKWRLGLCPQDATYNGLYCPRGITIPWWYEQELWAIKIRRPATTDRYRRVKTPNWKGQANALYGIQYWDLSCKTCLITEGEFDAIFLGQLSGCNVLTLGPQSSVLANRWFLLLPSIKQAYVVTDADGEENAATYWLDLLGKRGTRLYPPEGHKDITDAWRAGCDCRAMLPEELASARVAVPQSLSPVQKPELDEDTLIVKAAILTEKYPSW